MVPREAVPKQAEEVWPASQTDTYVCVSDAPAGICELVLESADIDRMVEVYERLGLGVLLREPGQVWLDAGESARIGIWSAGEKEHRDRGRSHVHFGDRSVYLSDPEGNRVELWDNPVPSHNERES